MRDNRRPQVIQVFLPSGEPRGIRIAEITTRTVQVIHIPRGHLAEAAGRREVSAVGVYFLVGEAENATKPIAYIGQTENCLKRFKEHDQTKEFWKHAIAIVSSTRKFTNAHVKYLEWHCIRMAKDAGRYTLDNGNAGGEPHTTEPMKAELMDALEVLEVLTSALGFPVVEPRPSQGAADVFHLGSKNGVVEARGQMAEDGFTVLAGSRGEGSVRKSAEGWVGRTRAALTKDGVVALDEGRLVFRKPHTFKSPSSAASTLLGGNTNGWLVWKAEDGRTLDEVKRQAPTDGPA